MDDQPRGNFQQKEGERQTFHPPPPPLIKEKEAGERGADTKAESAEASTETPAKSRWGRFKIWVWPMEFTDAVMIVLTIAIAIGTLVSAAAIFMQWKEMVKGGADTGALVGYAQRQAGRRRQDQTFCG